MPRISAEFCKNADSIFCKKCAHADIEWNLHEKLQIIGELSAKFELTFVKSLVPKGTFSADKMPGR